MSQNWNYTARLLHWGMAIAVLVIVPAGYIMAWTYGPAMKGGPVAALHLRASQVHHTLGLLILAAALFRLLWRLTHRAPANLGTRGWLAPRLVHGLLYALLLLLPLTGWASLSSLAEGAGFPAPSLWFFTQDGFGPRGWIPHLVSPKPWNAPGLLTYGTFARAHVYFVWAGGALLLLHIAGALWHHFGLRDAVLAGMLGRVRGE